MADDTDRVQRIEAIPDLGQRLRAATRQITVSQREANELGRLRKSLIKQMRSQGLSFAQIGEAAGLTRGRIHQILNSGPPAESMFFGHSPITVALPLRLLPGREEEPVISSEDSRAYDLLAALLSDLDFAVTRVAIPPDGLWRPPAGSVVAICGPKSSRVTADAIAADPFLSFDPDPSGRWVIRDRASGEIFESPIDSKRRHRNEDVAYLGRLTVNKQPVLFIAGVHSLGSVGAVDYLTRHLHDLYEAVGTRNFSMVVASKHDTGTVARSEAACQPRTH